MAANSGEAARGGIERSVFVLAASVVVVVGIRYASSIVAPVLLAIVATVTAYPVQRRLLDRGSHPLTALLATWATIYAVFVTGSLMLAVALVQLIQELPAYEQEVQDGLASVSEALGGTSTSTTFADQLSVTNIVAFAESVLGGITGLLGNAVVVVAVVFFLVIDGLRFADKYAAISAHRRHVAESWSRWGSETRVYLGVATIFGLVVASLDALLLAFLGVPLVLVWAMLAFVTNYIPNVGFVIGVIPPALLALLTDGWTTALWVVVGYSVINFTIQEFIQPKVVADSVDLAAAVSFVSVFFWTWVIGPAGAILCIPLTLFVRTVMLQPYETSRWVSDLISSGASPPEPDAQAGAIP